MLQNQAMIEVLVEFGWNYVSVVHTEGDYGSTGCVYNAEMNI